MTIDYESAVSGPTEEQLKTIAGLAHKQIELERELSAAEEAYNQAKKSLRKVQEIELPEAMQAVGMESFTLATGERVLVKETLYASIAQKNKRAAAQWLFDNGHGSLVKEDVVVPFEKGEHARLEGLIHVMEQSGFNQYKVNESVNTASVKALIKELAEKGENVPLELFGAYWHRKAQVKL